jgi:hypothetical protein
VPSRRHMETVRHSEELEQASLVEDEAVFLWRAETLERAGYSAKAVLMLATEKAVDLHQAVRLLRDGCPPDVALNILL